MSYLFDPAPQPALPIEGTQTLYPVRRIFCVGRNYAAHAAEMGGEVDREAPWYFNKSAHHLHPSGSALAYAPGTQNLHYEMELVFALTSEVFQASADEAAGAIGYMAAGLDMTRRDRQQDGKDARRPWDLGKDFEGGAVIAPLVPALKLDSLGPRRIQLLQNGEVKQDATLSEMVWSCAEITRHLSQYYHLGPGDLVMTGTPAGVGPVQPGDVLRGQIDGLPEVHLAISAAE